MFADGEIRKIVEQAIEAELPGLDVSPGSWGGALADIYEKHVKDLDDAFRIAYPAPEPVPDPAPVEYYETGVAGTRWPVGWARSWREAACK